MYEQEHDTDVLDIFTLLNYLYSTVSKFFQNLKNSLVIFEYGDFEKNQRKKIPSFQNSKCDIVALILTLDKVVSIFFNPSAYAGSGQQKFGKLTFYYVMHSREYKGLSRVV